MPRRNFSQGDIKGSVHANSRKSYLLTYLERYAQFSLEILSANKIVLMKTVDSVLIIKSNQGTVSLAISTTNEIPFNSTVLRSEGEITGQSSKT